MLSADFSAVCTVCVATATVVFCIFAMNEDVTYELALDTEAHERAEIVPVAERAVACQRLNPQHGEKLRKVCEFSIAVWHANKDAAFGVLVSSVQKKIDITALAYERFCESLLVRIEESRRSHIISLPALADAVLNF